MRVSRGLVIWAAANLLAAASSPLYAQQDHAKAADNPGLKAKEADTKDTRLSMDDIRELRRKRTAAGQVADSVAEKGRSFDVTDEVARELHGLGFNAAQVAEIKDASTDPLVPGKYLSSTDAERDTMMDLMQKAAAKSGVAIGPASTQHVTLWAAKSVRKAYLADVQKAEKFFHTKCAEPIRYGLDKRTSHIVVLNDRAECTAWWRAVLELDPKMFEVKGNPGYSEQIRREVVRNPVVNTTMISVFCAREAGPEWTRRSVAFGVGYQLATQLTNRTTGAVQTGFGNWTEAVVCGSPMYFGAEIVHGQDLQRGVGVLEDWGVIVKQRVTARKTSPLADLLKGDQKPSQAVYAESWLLVGLLNQQPAKFGKLLLAQKDGDTDPAAIKKTYGWDEKELEKQWRAYALKPGKKKPAG